MVHVIIWKKKIKIPIIHYRIFTQEWIMLFGLHPTHQTCDLILEEASKNCSYNSALALWSDEWTVTVWVGQQCQKFCVKSVQEVPHKLVGILLLVSPEIQTFLKLVMQVLKKSIFFSFCLILTYLVKLIHLNFKTTNKPSKKEGTKL